MKQLTATPSGILIPRETRASFPCGYCPRTIYKDKEAKGRLFVTQEGKAICAVCRIMRGKMGAQIRKDSRLLRGDQEEKRKLEIKQENDRVIDIAIASQERHKDSDTEK